MLDEIEVGSCSFVFPKLKVVRLEEEATLPTYATAGSAGLDLYAFIPPEWPNPLLTPGAIRIFSTGLKIEIPPGYEGQVRSRSGLSCKHGVSVVNSPGTIDSDYRGVLMVALTNHSHLSFQVTHGMRIAQLVIAPVSRLVVEEVETLSETLRGAGGLGSTGV